MYNIYNSVYILLNSNLRLYASANFKLVAWKKFLTIKILQ